MISLIIPGSPQGKQRARVFLVHGRMIATTPKKTRTYEAVIRDLFCIQYPDFVPLQEALAVSVRAFHPIPKSMSKKDRARIESGEMKPTTRPDADNCLKAVLDALEGVAYRNDSQVVSLRAEKFYSEQPRMEIEIRETGGEKTS
jgi:Holliday junction resolvase RusA-like endonuclease